MTKFKKGFVLSIFLILVVLFVCFEAGKKVIMSGSKSRLKSAEDIADQNYIPYSFSNANAVLNENLDLGRKTFMSSSKSLTVDAGDYLGDKYASGNSNIVRKNQESP